MLDRPRLLSAGGAGRGTMSQVRQPCGGEVHRCGLPSAFLVGVMVAGVFVCAACTGGTDKTVNRACATRSGASAVNVRLTDRQPNSSISVRRGEEIRFTAVGSDQIARRPPRSTDPHVLCMSATRRTGPSARAEFVARSVGRASLIADPLTTGDIPQMPFTLRVHVVQ